MYAGDTVTAARVETAVAPAVGLSSGCSSNSRIRSYPINSSICTLFLVAKMLTVASAALEL